jgi:4-carboxymuconolactone decarboxylase
MRRENEPTTAAPRRAPASPDCKARRGCSSTPRRASSCPRSTAISALNRYLRFQSGISPRTREIAILITAREMDSQFEWVAHEPEALKEGVPPAVIDVIKYRRSTEGLEEVDAIVIELGRQIWRDHKVTSATFARAKELFGPNKLVDLVVLMGNYASTAALLTTVDMQLHAGKKPLLPIP